MAGRYTWLWLLVSLCIAFGSGCGDDDGSSNPTSDVAADTAGDVQAADVPDGDAAQDTFTADLDTSTGPDLPDIHADTSDTTVSTDTVACPHVV